MSKEQEDLKSGNSPHSPLNLRGEGGVINPSFHKRIIHILLIITLVLISYSNTFHATFHLDDKDNIEGNPIVKDLHFFIEPSSAKDLEEYVSFKARYIGYLTFALNYKINGLDVTGYHIFNNSIHIISGLLVYWLLILTFRTPFFRSLPEACRPLSPDLIALFAALLFAVHPLQTQAVTYIVQRFASLAAMFYLLSLTMYVKWRLLKQGSAKERKKGFNVKFTAWYLCALFSAVLAMKTKEIAFTLPIIIVLYEFIFFEGKIRRRIIYLIPFVLTMFIIPLSLTGADKPLGVLMSDAGSMTRVGGTTMPRYDYLLTEFRVIITYIRLIFFPVNQNLDYDFPVYHFFFNPEVFISFLFLLLILSISIYLLYSSRLPVRQAGITHHASRLAAFGILWFFVTLSVESSIIPIPDVIFEHRVYLPSIGIFMALSGLMFMAIEKRKNTGKAVLIALPVIIIILSATTYARNNVWKDDYTLWTDVAQKSPAKERAHINLGQAYHSKGLDNEAMEHYKTALTLNPNLVEAYNNIGNIFLSRGLADEAIEQYKAALKLKPYSLEAHFNLGNAYFSRGYIDSAIGHYEIAVRLKPYIPEIHNNLGNAYFSKGLIDKAMIQYRIALQLKPDFAGAQNNLENAYRAIKKH